MTCYAWFGKPEETMEQHISVGLDIIERHYIRRNYHHLIAYELEVSVDIAKEILKLSYILHDAGKGLTHFQNREKGFGGHQEFSAGIAYRVMDEYGKLVKDVVSAAILLHHHDWVRRNSLDIQDLTVSEDCREVLEKHSRFKIPNKVKKMDPEKISEILTRNLKKIYILLLPIVVADNYAATKNRGGDTSGSGPLVKEIMESLRCYPGEYGYVDSNYNRV